MSEVRVVPSTPPRLRPVETDPDPDLDLDLDRRKWDAAVQIGPGRFPRPLTSLIGREADAAAARALLEGGVRLLTLTGPGGVGKTRLALRIAEPVPTLFTDGAVFVPLGAITDPDLVMPTIARQLGLRDVAGLSVGERLVSHLRECRLLLVLDNVEQVRGAAPQLAQLLSACPDLAILATSRALLHINGEQPFQVLPLGVPEPALPGALDPVAVAAAPAVQLFTARTRTVDPTFLLDDGNAAVVAAICRRLDGVPLALELAAARMRLLAPAELLARLERTLPLLTGGPADLPHRQRTVWQTVAWSYDQLAPTAQALMRRLAVFVGGVTLEAAEVVGGDGFALGGDGPAGLGKKEDEGEATPSSSVLSAASPLKAAGRLPLSAASPPKPKATPPHVLDALAMLLDDSLLRRIPGGDGRPRFVMLETVREFALEQLTAHGALAAAREAQASYCLSLAERGEPELLDGDRIVWTERLAAELPNLREALTWWLERGDPEKALRLAGALGLFWTDPHYQREGRAWLEAAAALPGARDAPAALAKVLNAIGVVGQWQGDFARVAEALAAALAMRQALGDSLGVAEVLGNQGHLALGQGDLARATALLTESLPHYERAGKAFWVGETLMLLGHTVQADGDSDRSAAYHEAAAALFRGLPGQGKLDDALLNLGWVQVLRGDLASAATAYAEGVILARDHDDALRQGRCVRGAAGLVATMGDARRAARLFAAAAAQREREQIALQPVIQADHDRLLAGVRHALGAAGFEAAWNDGYCLPLPDALAESAGIFDTVRERSAPAGRGSGEQAPALDTAACLTPRELDVLRLLANGQSDKEIATALFISQRTASSHVSAILGKLGVESRTSAVAVALRRGLVGDGVLG